MMPRKRNRENAGLPKRWRYRNGTYSYMVPPGQEQHWDGKKEFVLGRNLVSAHETFSDRLKASESGGDTIGDLIDRYTREVTPKKAPRTRKDEVKLFETLKKMIGHNQATAWKTHHCESLYNKIQVERGLTSANRYMEKLSHLFTMAIKWKESAVEIHPMKGKFEKTKPEAGLPYVTDAMVDSALPYASDRLQAYVGLKLLTGLRMSDMLSIKLSDLQEDGIHVKPSKTAKSSGVKQIFEWTPALHAAVDRIQEQNRVLKGKQSVVRLHGFEYLFCKQDGDGYIKRDGTTTAFNNMWQRWMKRVKNAGLEPFKERQLRTKVGSDSETDEEAAKILGDSVTTTKKHYRVKPERVRPTK